MLALKKPDTFSQFFEIRLGSVPAGEPLSYDIYLVVNQKPVLFRKRGDVLTADRMRSLASQGGERFLVPEDMRGAYLGSLRDPIHDLSTKTETKARFIKELAFLHIHDLFIRKDIHSAVNEVRGLVEDMVNFVSADTSAVAALMRLAAHDYYTYNHCVNVGVYSIAIAKRVYGDNKQILMTAGMGGLLHDLGKKRIEWSVINKVGPLTAAEWEEIKRHPVYGKEELKSIPNIDEGTKSAVFEHHEAFDGSGYPQGLKEDEISKLARLVSIADVFDALTTDRSYHSAIGPTDALNTMFGMQPGKFDPGMFGSFNRNFEKKSPVVIEGNFDPCSPIPIPKRPR